MAKSTPIQFDVPSAHCSACVNGITTAAKRVDPEASVSVDLKTKRVVIGGEGEVQDFIAAVEAAGFEVKAAT
jgi:copper chaperone